MRKFIVVLAALALCGLPALAETDYLALPKINDIVKGVNNANQIETLRVSGAATIGGAATVKGRAVATSKGTDRYMADGATRTMSAGETTFTGTFTTVYTTAPSVTWNCNGCAGTNFTVTIATNAFTIPFAGTNLTVNWHSWGLKSN